MECAKLVMQRNALQNLCNTNFVGLAYQGKDIVF
jgi:hypothetical protein